MNKNAHFIAFFLAFSMFILLLFPHFSIVYAKDHNEEKKGYDIIFALDVSASMNTTDKNRNSIEIIKMMIDMCTTGDTRIGFVAYNDTIKTHFALADVSNTSLREDLKDVIGSSQFSGYSDMGLGLKYALKLISKGEDIGNKPIIILLSDGETDLSGSKTGRTDKDSKIDLENSVAASKKLSIPIYTIGLTGNFNTDLDYLKDISLQTGGISYTAASPYQLVDIFNGILSENTSSVLTPVESITASGKNQYLDIGVSNDSLSELNIMLLSDESLKVKEVLTSSSDYSISLSTSYQLIKIADPVRETIRIKVSAAKGSEIRLSTLGTYAFSDVLTVPGTIPKNKTAKFVFRFKDNKDDSFITDEKLYQSISLDFYIKDLTTGDETKLKGVSGPEGFTLDDVFKKPGKYKIRTLYNGDSIFGKSDSYGFEVLNTPPRSKKELTDTIAKEKGGKTYDVSSLFGDSDGDPLTYSVVSSKGADALVSLSGNQLTVTPDKYGDVFINVQAEDADGATADTEIIIKSIPIWKYYHNVTIIILIFVIVIITLALSFIIIRFFKKRVSMPKPVFTGCLAGYFLALKNGGEIPPLKWQLSDYPNKGISLSRLLKARSIETVLPDAEKIWFSPKVGNTIELIHNTRCTVLVGPQTIPRNTPVTIHFGDKIFVAFEDMESEIEIRYKNI